MKSVAIIPARAGSKRVPGKNIRPLGGLPALGYPLRACLASGLFTRVIVSTDSPQVAQLAVSLGAEAPFLRPPELADDWTLTAPVMLHCLQQLLEDFEAFCCVYPTAIFLHPEDLAQGHRLLAAGAQTAFAVTSFDFPIQRALRLTAEGTLEMVWPEHEKTRSNDLPEMLHDAGQFYWRRTSDFLTDPRMYGVGARPVMVPRHRAQDIDTPEDWELVERLFAGASP